MEAHNHMIRYPAVGALIKLTQVVLRTKSKVTVIVCDQRGNSIPTGTARHSRQLHSQQCNVFVSDLRLTQVCICACVCGGPGVAFVCTNAYRKVTVSLVS